MRCCRPSSSRRGRGAVSTDAPDDIVAISRPSRPARTSAGAAKTSSAGTTLLDAGRVLRPQDIGVMSSIGLADVHGRPPAARPARHHRQRAAALGLGTARLPDHRRQRTDARRAGRARRRRSSTSPVSCATMPRRFSTALHADADIVIVSGGSSVGIEDLAPIAGRAARRTGRARHCDAAEQPDRHRAASATRLVFLLPGNPVSALCAPTTSSPAARFARSAAVRRSGRTARCAARSTRKISSPIGRLDYARVRVDRRPVEPLVRLRRVGAVVDDARRRVRDRRRRQRRLRCGQLRWTSGSMREQEQFLHVLDRDEAERRFRAAIDLAPRGIETVPLDAALGRVLAADVTSPVDVPSFDRSNVDGFAVDRRGHVRRVRGGPARRAARRRDHPHRRSCRRRSFDVATAVSHRHRRHDAARRRCRRDGRACRRRRPASCASRRAVTAGSGVSFAGTDITAGETVLRRGQILTSRDTGVLAAIGVAIGRRLAEADRRDPLDRRRDHRARRSRCSRRASTTRTRRCSPMPCASWAASRVASASRRTMSTRCARRLRDALDDRRHRAALGRHEQGRRRRLVSRRRRADRSRASWRTASR